MTRSLALLVALIAYARALTITSPGGGAGWQTGEGVKNEISWSAEAGDPALVTVRLINADETKLNGGLALASNIATSGVTTLDVGRVEVTTGEGYIVELVSLTDVNVIYAASIPFSITAGTSAPSPSTSAAPSSTIAPAAGQQDDEDPAAMAISASASASVIVSLPGEKTNDTMASTSSSIAPSRGMSVPLPPASSSATMSLPPHRPSNPSNSGSAIVAVSKLALALLAIIAMGGPGIGRI